MQTLLSWSIGLYFLAYTLEGPIRFGLHTLNLDTFIFLRDIFLGTPLLVIFIQQFLKREIHPAYLLFIFVILLHGTIMLLNFGSFLAVLYGTKMLMSMLAGAVAPPKAFRPSRNGLLFFASLWTITVLGVVLDKYFFDFPWVGLEATIGDYHVDISQDWQISGADKRAGGFMRSSINVAILEPLLAFTIFYNIRQQVLRVMVLIVTAWVLYLSTQKGAIVAYALTLGIIFISRKDSLSLLRYSFFFFLALSITLPLVLPGYQMPSSSGVFSFASFYQRIEDMWPRGWRWIEANEIFPFGVGLGGISGAQRVYSPDEINDADNIFIFMYAFFGLMTFVYFGLLSFSIIKLPSICTNTDRDALTILVFLAGYGCVISIIEDQMGSLFIGAAAAWISYERQFFIKEKTL